MPAEASTLSTAGPARGGGGGARARARWSCRHIEHRSPKLKARQRAGNRRGPAEAMPARRSWRGELEAPTPGTVGPASEWAGLGAEQEALLAALQGGAVARRLPILNIQHGAGAADAIGMPVAAWLLGECLLHWAVRWRAAEVGPGIGLERV